LLWLALLPACGGGPTGGSSPPPATSTTTTTSTTSTTTSTTSTTVATTTTTTSTTTSTTTTTQPSLSYAVIHPLWTSRGCTSCHTAANRLNLSAGPNAVCSTIRDGSDRQGVQYLDNPGCTGNVAILRVPGTGLLTNNTNHPGGVDSCFGNNGNCQRDILAWCRGGAGC
jgi:hypothetical protein